MQSATPPTIDFFESLPAIFWGVWAVYVLVLTKPGCIPLIYVGTGTRGRKEGASQRLDSYDRLEWSMLPRFVAAALRDGYQITHKGTLAWAPVPTPGQIPKTRLLFLALEATFSFLFWAMKSRDKDYNMGSCCPWPRSSFTYGGLCSHNALWEKPAGDFELTEEQLEEMAAEAKEKKRKADKAYHDKQRRDGVERVRQRQREADRRFSKTEKGRAKRTRRRERNKAAKHFYCKPCDYTGHDATRLRRHNASERHRKKVAAAAAAETAD